MYLMYTDESGDPGLSGGGTPFFVVTGVIVHETDWNEVFQRLLDLRRNLSTRFGVRQRIAFHATDIVNGNGDYHHSQSGMTRSQRFEFYREILEFVAQLSQLRVLNVFIRKSSITDPTINVFEWAWQYLVQRFHTFLERRGHLDTPNDFGMLITDRTRDDELRRLVRRMRAFNFVPSQYSGSEARRLLVTRVLDDPSPRASDHSYFVQIADLVAYSLARRDFPRTALSSFSFETYFDIVDPILHKPASNYDPQGIVFWPRQ